MLNVLGRAVCLVRCSETKLIEENYVTSRCHGMKFPDDNKPKRHLIFVLSNSIDLIQLLVICQMLAKFPGVGSERNVPKLRKRKKKVRWCVHVLHKADA